MGLLTRIGEAFQPKPQQTTTQPVRRPVVARGGKTRSQSEYRSITLLDPLAVPHTCNLESSEAAYMRVPYIKATIDKKANFAMSLNPVLKSDSEAAKQAIEKLNEMINFNQIRRKSLLSLSVYGFCAWEKVATQLMLPSGEIVGNSNTPVRLKYIDPKTFYVKRDDTGTVIGYCQIIDNNLIPLNKFEVVYVPGQTLGDSPYGVSDIEVLFGNKTINYLKGKLETEKALKRLVEKFVNVPIQVKVGRPEDKVPAADVQAVQSALESMRNDAAWATSGDVDVVVPSFAGKSVEYQPILAHFDQQIMFSAQVPEVLLGKGSIPEGLAQEQMKAFQFVIQANLELLEEALETQLYTPYLAQLGIADKVELDWEDFPEVKEKDITLLSTLLGNSGLTTQTKLDLENKLREKLGLVGKAVTPLTPIPSISPLSNIFPREARESFDVSEMSFPLALQPKVVEQFNLKQAVVDFLQSYTFGQVSENSDFIEPLRQVLIRGIQNGSSISQMTRELAQTMGEDKASQAETLIRTELARAENESALAIFKSSNLVQNVKFITAEDERVSDECADYDGKIFSLTEAEGMIPLHPSCRCTFVPVQ